jgi:ABC-type branched-subunit amino acid transport system ATPase component
MGVLPHTQGSIRFLGEEVGEAEVEEMVALGVIIWCPNRVRCSGDERGG